jgi:hypothetical protein
MEQPRRQTNGYNVVEWIGLGIMTGLISFVGLVVAAILG